MGGAAAQDGDAGGEAGAFRQGEEVPGGDGPAGGGVGVVGVVAAGGAPTVAPAQVRVVVEGAADGLAGPVGEGEDAGAADGGN